MPVYAPSTIKKIVQQTLARIAKEMDANIVIARDWVIPPYDFGNLVGSIPAIDAGIYATIYHLLPRAPNAIPISVLFINRLDIAWVYMYFTIGLYNEPLPIMKAYFAKLISYNSDELARQLQGALPQLLPLVRELVDKQKEATAPLDIKVAARLFRELGEEISNHLLTKYPQIFHSALPVLVKLQYTGGNWGRTREDAPQQPERRLGEGYITSVESLDVVPFTVTVEIPMKITGGALIFTINHKFSIDDRCILCGESTITLYSRLAHKLPIAFINTLPLSAINGASFTDANAYMQQLKQEAIKVANTFAKRWLNAKPTAERSAVPAVGDALAASVGHTIGKVVCALLMAHHPTYLFTYTIRYGAPRRTLPEQYEAEISVEIAQQVELGKSAPQRREFKVKIVYEATRSVEGDVIVRNVTLVLPQTTEQLFNASSSEFSLLEGSMLLQDNNDLHKLSQLVSERVMQIVMSSAQHIVNNILRGEAGAQ